MNANIIEFGKIILNQTTQPPNNDFYSMNVAITRSTLNEIQGKQSQKMLLPLIKNAAS